MILHSWIDGYLVLVSFFDTLPLACADFSVMLSIDLVPLILAYCSIVTAACITVFGRTAVVIVIAVAYL